jgi:glycosyltransferase involved in cell wall biosynthesis
MDETLPTLSLLMPVLNEQATLGRAIQEVEEANLAAGGYELIIIDDGSTDESPEIMRASQEANARVRVLTHPRNLGKGSAIQTGLSEARGQFTAIIDADLEYRPSDIELLLEPLGKGLTDAAFGVRGFEAHSSFSFWYVMGNKGVTMAANILFNCWLSDIMTCHKAIRTEIFRDLPLRESGFAIEPEITAELLKRDIPIYEVPVSYSARSRDAGKKLTAVDGFRVLRTLVRCRVS